MSPKFPLSCEYDHLAFVPEEFGGTKKEQRPEKESLRVKRPQRPYAELRAASAFSFLDGASLPEDLICRAAEKDVPAMALVDTNGVYGAPRFYGAAKKAGIKALVGAELVLSSTSPAPANAGEGPAAQARGGSFAAIAAQDLGRAAQDLG